MHVDWRSLYELVTIHNGIWGNVVHWLWAWTKSCPYCEGRVTIAAPWAHAAMCDNTYSDICMIIHGDSCFNLVKSVDRYRLRMTVRRTTRAYHGTIVTKGLFITCPSANIIGIKGKLILRCNDSGIYFWK